ncbi:hypothetical protein, partial [Sulfitobacter sp.]|uniref:hypothetical protein n=1 Tax=Sulfitobacter sp. TaxID=1903071 RepID=UPI003F6C24C0
AGTSNAQTVSVLERVLGTIDNATNLASVNGVYANIAENIGTVPVPYEVVTPEQTVVNSVLPNADAILVAYFFYDGGNAPLYLSQIGVGEVTLTTPDAAVIIVDVDEELNITIVEATDASGNTITEFNEVTDASTYIRHELSAGEGRFNDVGEGDTFNLLSDEAIQNYIDWSGSILTIEEVRQSGWLDLGNGTARLTFRGLYDEADWNTRIATGDILMFSETYITIPEVRETFYYYNPETIDGSINNTVTGVVEATALATASLATATEFTLPTMDFGDMATTALGAVNTGDITLGVNSAVDEAQTSTTAAISAALEQIGGSVDTGAIVINVASNANAINGSINNVLNQVNGSIGNLSTTALGAVNTSTIVSGVDAAVQGIVGMSGQSSF